MTAVVYPSFFLFVFFVGEGGVEDIYSRWIGYR